MLLLSSHHLSPEGKQYPYVPFISRLGAMQHDIRSSLEHAIISLSPHFPPQSITPAMNRTDHIHYTIQVWAARQITSTHVLGLHRARKWNAKGGAKEGPVMSCCFRICRLTPAGLESMQRMYAGAKEGRHTAVGA
jgi:hypothetical protein